MGIVHAVAGKVVDDADIKDLLNEHVLVWWARTSRDLDVNEARTESLTLEDTLHVLLCNDRALELWNVVAVRDYDIVEVTLILDVA